ncbi:MAG: hypothetical protein JST54_34575 [Deltaproteobacteria bacterium]|nr:hypothetical protein [Deltaproteobacteria bacterium]
MTDPVAQIELQVRTPEGDAGVKREEGCTCAPAFGRIPALQHSNLRCAEPNPPVT